MRGKESKSAERMTVWALGTEVDRDAAFAAADKRDKQLTSPTSPAHSPRCTPHRPPPTSSYFTASLDASLFICRSVSSPIQIPRSPALVHRSQLSLPWLPLPRRLLCSAFYGIRLPQGSTTTLQCTGSKSTCTTRTTTPPQSSELPPTVTVTGPHTSIV